MPFIDTRQRAHELIDRMAASQVSAVVGLLETMLDPFARTFANAPYDDEPVGEEDRRDIAESRGVAERLHIVPNDPVARAIANAPFEDEEIGEEEERAVAESKRWLAEHPGETVSHAEMMAEFGLTADDLAG